jgi:hypothetical protein
VDSNSIRKKRVSKPAIGKAEVGRQQINFMKSRTDVKSDEDELFLLSLAPALKRIEPRLKLSCKTAIMKAIDDHELGNYNRPTVGSQAPRVGPVEATFMNPHFSTSNQSSGFNRMYQWQQQPTDNLNFGIWQLPGNSTSTAIHSQSPMSMPTQPTWQNPVNQAAQVQNDPLQSSMPGNQPTWTYNETRQREESQQAASQYTEI